MKNIIIFMTLILIGFHMTAQKQIEWSEEIIINEKSFQGTLPNLTDDNYQEYYFSTSFDFNFQMLSLQFTFTKNFNKYVTAYYVPEFSWMEEGDLTEQLLLMANMDFDLVELFARKFRKKLFEAKNLGSNVNFFSHLHNEINNEYIARNAEIRSRLKTTDNLSDYLVEDNDRINAEIQELGEFCKTCKPQKKKK